MMQFILQDNLALTSLTLSSIIAGLNLAFFSRSGPESKINGLIGWVSGTLIWYIVSVLFGVAVVDKMTETLLFSVLMSSMTCVAAPAYLGLNGDRLKHVFVMFDAADTKEKWLLGTTLGGVLGAWIGVWPIPLDWEVWWQNWPIPCFTGAIVGYCASLLILTLGRLASKNDRDKVRKD